MVSDNSADYCTKSIHKNNSNTLSFENFQRGLKFARTNAYTPVIVYDDKELDLAFEKELENYEVLRIKPASLAHQGNHDNAIIVLDSKDFIKLESGKFFNQIIFHIQKNDFSLLDKFCVKIFTFARKINLIIDDWDKMTEEDNDFYRQALERTAKTIVEYYKSKKVVQLNVLSDIMITTNKINCGAGHSSILLAPNSELYPCPSFYHSKRYNSIGNLEVGIVDDISSYRMSDSPVCSLCDINSCHMCILNNIEGTHEYKIPTLQQCRMKNAEKSVSRELQEQLIALDEKTPFRRNILQEQKFPELLDLMVYEKYSQYR